MPLAARQKRDERDERRPRGRRPGSSTPAAPGAANTSTFLTHCLGRAVTSRLKASEGVRSTSGCARLRCRDRPLGGYGHRSQSIGIDLLSSVVMTELVADVVIYTRTGDDGTHRAAVRRPGPARTPPARRPTATSTRRSRRSASPGRRPSATRSSTGCSIRLQRELFVVGAELATAPANRGKLEPGVSRVTAEMVAALEPIIDDVSSRFDPPQEFVLPGENRGRGRARPRPHGRAAGRALGRGGRARRAGSTTATSSPT